MDNPDNPDTRLSPVSRVSPHTLSPVSLLLRLKLFQVSRVSPHTLSRVSLLFQVSPRLSNLLRLLRR
tara:strand:- start:190 stop:390 length:201 start_codon:yes stop_codon:yes gene_type:complete